MRSPVALYAEQRARKCERWLADPKEVARDELRAARDAYRDVRDYAMATTDGVWLKVSLFCVFAGAGLGAAIVGIVWTLS